MKSTIVRLMFFVFLSNTCAYGKECVVLIHGLGRTERALYPVGKYLKANGYDVTYINYKSTKYDIKTLCSLYVDQKMQVCLDKYDKVHIVTHSLGGILIRYYLQNKKIDKIGRIVMLAPPNQGSDLVDFLKKNLGFLYESVNGPAGQQLSTDSSGICSRLLPISYEIGIIAGDRSWEPWFSLFIQSNDDGKVSIKNTRLLEMKDFIRVHHTHTFMMNCKDIHLQIIQFLNQGYFDNVI